MAKKNSIFFRSRVLICVIGNRQKYVFIGNNTPLELSHFHVHYESKGHIFFIFVQEIYFNADGDAW